MVYCCRLGAGRGSREKTAHQKGGWLTFGGQAVDLAPFRVWFHQD